MTIGKFLSERRKAQGLTQDQLAEKVGVSAQAVSKWENDLARPDADMLLVLAEIYGTTVDSLLRGTVAPTVKEDTEENIRKRVVSIKVDAEGTHVSVKIPASLIVNGICNMGALIPKSIADEMTDEAEMSVEEITKSMAPIVDFIKSGVLGTVTEVKNERAHVIISVEEYE